MGNFVKIFAQKATKIRYFLVSDLFSQSWKGLFPLVKPKPGDNFLPQEINKNVQEMISHVDQYFVDIGFERQRNEFYDHSVFQQTTHQMSCEKSAWDFQDGREYRISMCAKPKRDDIHEMIYLFATGIKYY